MNLHQQWREIAHMLKNLIRIHQVKILIRDWQWTFEIGNNIDTFMGILVQPDGALQFVTSAPNVQYPLSNENIGRRFIMRQHTLPSAA